MEHCVCSMKIQPIMQFLCDAEQLRLFFMFHSSRVLFWLLYGFADCLHLSAVIWLFFEYGAACWTFHFCCVLSMYLCVCVCDRHCHCYFCGMFLHFWHTRYTVSVSVIHLHTNQTYTHTHIPLLQILEISRQIFTEKIYHFRESNNLCVYATYNLRVPQTFFWW